MFFEFDSSFIAETLVPCSMPTIPIGSMPVKGNPRPREVLKGKDPEVYTGPKFQGR